MPFYRDQIYPQLVRVLGDPNPIREVRERIVPLAEGKVLEIGVGPGVNFVYYDPARVTHVYALEPNPGMMRLAERQRRRSAVTISFIDLPGEQIPLENGSVDTVLSTFTLCTIPGVVDALRGVRRVLKPGGKLIFFEHGLSPDGGVRRWQEWSEPIAHWLFEGLPRDTGHSLSDRPERLPDWMDGGSLPRRVPEVVDVLLVGGRLPGDQRLWLVRCRADSAQVRGPRSECDAAEKHETSEWVFT